MTLPLGLRDREYQRFKDTEVFIRDTITASGVNFSFITSTPRVGDILIYNSGSNNIFYNLGISGATVVTSTSGNMLEAGGKVTYDNVGFDIIALTSPSGGAVVFAQKIYSSRD